MVWAGMSGDPTTASHGGEGDRALTDRKRKNKDSRDRMTNTYSGVIQIPDNPGCSEDGNRAACHLLYLLGVSRLVRPLVV